MIYFLALWGISLGIIAYLWIASDAVDADYCPLMQFRKSYRKKGKDVGC